VETTAEPQSHRRLVAVTRVALIWAVLILARLVYLQVFHYHELRQSASAQQVRTVRIRAPRGSIYDRNGAALALSVPVETVIVNPSRIPDLGLAVELLSRTLGLDHDDLEEKLKASIKREKGFLLVKQQVPAEEANRLRSYGLDYVEFRQDSKRIYPKSSLAAHLLGGVDHDERGDAGLELALEDDLESRTGMLRLVADSQRRGIDSQELDEAQAGKNFTLTIDERIQFMAEKYLKEAAELNHTPTGSIICMRARTNEILAMASYPGFDANQPLAVGESMANRLNLAVAAPFEPGSVFKVITLAAALETTKLRPESIIPCGNGSIRFGDRVIKDHESYSALSMADVLANSSNIGAINIGLKVGEKNLYEYIKRFGFGHTMGLPVPNEAPGKLRSLRHWSKSSIGSIAMGHEIMATTVQLAQACSIVANNGVLIKPKLVMKIQRPGEAAEPIENEPPRKVIEPETAFKLRQMMEGVMLHGTAKLSRLKGYTAGGKTGSAQIFNFETHKYTHKYNASFMGFAPVTNPEIIVVVTLNGATKLAGTVAAPVFKDVATAALRILGIPTDIPDGKEEPMPVNEAPVSDLAIAGLSDHNPLEDDADEIASENGAQQVSGPRVPNFRGMTLRAVMEKSAAAGLQIEVSGNGLARRQDPPAGAVLPQGERIRVQFAR
jgi:cell division protein FtsI (penicillin-binding protein 3)